jgi:hypothetical protein
MRHVLILVFGLFMVLPAAGQGLTINMSQTDATGKKTPQVLQADRTRVRLDLPNGGKLLYDSEAKKLHAMLPGATVYVELTPQLVQMMIMSSGRGQPTGVPVTYKRGGSSKVGAWTCVVYEGFQGTEKVAELCAAESPAIALTAADFVIAQQALSSVKGAISKDVLDGIPVYGSADAQGFVGFPVRRSTFVNGKLDATVELIDIRRGAVPETAFAVPTAPVALPANRGR